MNFIDYSELYSKFLISKENLPKYNNPIDFTQGWKICTSYKNGDTISTSTNSMLLKREG